MEIPDKAENQYALYAFGLVSVACGSVHSVPGLCFHFLRSSIGEFKYTTRGFDTTPFAFGYVSRGSDTTPFEYGTKGFGAYPSGIPKTR